MRTPQVSFFTFYAQSCKIFMSQQWGPGRCPLKCSVDIFSSGVIAPEFHVNTALSAPPQKKDLLLFGGRWLSPRRADGVHVFTEGVVGWHLREKKRGGSVCSVNIYSDSCWMSTDWLGWMVCVWECVWAGDRETVKPELSVWMDVRCLALMNRFRCKKNITFYLPPQKTPPERWKK